MIRIAVVLIALILSTPSALAEPRRNGVTCTTVREAVATFGIGAARQYARTYLTPAQIAWAKRCLRKSR